MYLDYQITCVHVFPPSAVRSTLRENRYSTRRKDLHIYIDISYHLDLSNKLKVLISGSKYYSHINYHASNQF